MRRPKRISTWADFSSRGRSRNAALKQVARAAERSVAVLARNCRCTPARRARSASRGTVGNAGPARRRADALGLDERAQDRQRQIGVAGLDRLIEPVRQLALARQRAMPFALVIGDAADLPLRQFQIDQRQRRIGPGARLDQPLDAGGLAALAGRRKAPAGLADDVGQEFGGDGIGIAEPVAEFGGVLVFCKEVTWRYLIGDAADTAAARPRWSKSPFENEMRRGARDIGIS